MDLHTPDAFCKSAGNGSPAIPTQQPVTRTTTQEREVLRDNLVEQVAVECFYTLLDRFFFILGSRDVKRTSPGNNGGVVMDIDLWGFLLKSDPVGLFRLQPPHAQDGGILAVCRSVLGPHL